MIKSPTITVILFLVLSITGCRDESEQVLPEKNKKANTNISSHSSNESSFNDPFRSSASRDPFQSNERTEKTATNTTNEQYNTKTNRQDMEQGFADSMDTQQTTQRDSQQNVAGGYYSNSARSSSNSPNLAKPNNELNSGSAALSPPEQFSPATTETAPNHDSPKEPSSSLVENISAEAVEPTSQKPKVNCPASGQLPSVWDNSYNRLQLAMAGCHIQ